MDGIKVAVTGAGGFIGGRLAQMLEQSGASVTRLTRRQRLAEPGRAAEALSGCAALVHCAFDAYDEAANLRLAEALGSACATAGIRLVHLSTAAVYEPLPDGTLTETAPTDAPGTAYKTTKLAVEARLLSLVPAGLSLVILQPTIVYGSAGGAWTDGPVRELLTGEVMLPDGGQGLCNAVHVDDLCRAAIVACTAVVPSGERLLVSGPAAVTWTQFLGAYQAMLGVDALRLEPAGRSAPAAIAAAAPSGIKQALRRMVLNRLGAAGRTRLNYAVQRLRGRRVYRAEGAKRALYEARCTVSTAKATTLLGWRPLLDLAAGMAATRDYVQATYKQGKGFQPLTRSKAEPLKSIP